MERRRARRLDWETELLEGRRVRAALAIGSGGSGKTTTAESLADRVEEVGRGATIVSGRRASAADFDAPSADVIIVDDAHELSPDAADAAIGLGEDRSASTSLIMFARPRPGSSVLASLEALAQRFEAFVRLGPITNEELGELAREGGLSIPDSAECDSIRARTAGNPLLATRLMEELADQDPSARLVDSIRTQISLLSADARRALVTLAALDQLDETGSPPSGELITSGLVSDEGRIAGAIVTNFDGIFTATDFDDEQTRIAYLAAGDAYANVDPLIAATWYERAGAMASGALAAALASAGAYVEANRALQNAVDGDPRAKGAAAQMATAQGRWADAARLLDDVTGHPRWTDELARVVAATCRLIGGEPPRVDLPTPDTGDVTGQAMARAYHALATTIGPDLPADHGDRLRSCAREAPALEPSLDLPLGVLEVAAAAGLSVGEFATSLALLSASPEVADRTRIAAAFRRWLQHRAGGEGGEAARADRDDGPLAVRVFDLATDAALARRAGDVAVGSDILDDLTSIVSLASVDLLTIDAIAELSVLAQRFDARGAARTLDDALDRFLEALDNPPLWKARAAYARLEGTVAAADALAVRAAADELAKLPRGIEPIEPLIDAGRAWVGVFEGPASCKSLDPILDELEEQGYVWEASLLAGQAAIRATDQDDAKRLLSRSRTAREADVERPVHSAAGLSQREIEIGRLVLAGETYKEIGAACFISPKTVEHHVAHIRQKLNAVGVPRAEFRAALRADLEPASQDS